jgi:hypothetical protein
MILPATLLTLLWGTVVARLPTLWRDRRQRAFWLAIATLALTKTLAYAHAPGVLPHLLGVLVGYFMLRFIALLTGAGGGRWRLGLAVTVLAVLGALAAAAGGIDVRAHVLAGDLSPVVVAYWVVLNGYLGAVLATTTVMFWTVARDAPAGLPRHGLRAIAAGAALVGVYATVKTTLIVVHGFGVPVDFPSIEPAARAGQALGIMIAVAGAAVPAARRTRAVLAAYRDLLVLRPLWTAMRDAFPEVILFSPRRAVIELAGVDDVFLRLYRRVIEIRDGMLALRPHLPPDPPAADDPAVAEAMTVDAALRRRAAGEPPGEGGGWHPVGPEMADEVAWLSRVSRSYGRCSDSQTLRISSLIVSRPRGDTSAARSAISATPASERVRSRSSWASTRRVCSSSRKYDTGTPK